MRLNRSRLLNLFLALWGGSLGFIVGAALAALAGRVLGLWPPGEARLKSFKGRDDAV